MKGAGPPQPRPATPVERERIMRQPVLTTARMTLTPLSHEHLEWETELDSDPEVLRYLYPRAQTRAETALAHRRRMAAAERAAGLGFWVGSVAGEFVGWWILQPPHGPDQPDVAGEADLGYRLLRRRWRQGLASEGARELLRYGFDDVGLNRIFAQTLATNLGSRAVMNSIGMTFVRSFASTSDDRLPGIELGEVEYAITKQQWCHRS